LLIRIFSDIHWEFDKKGFWNPEPLETDKDTVLILAGDLYYGTRSLDIIETFNERFKKVIILLGNHDYWGNNVDTLDAFYKNEIKIAKLDNVVLLEKDTVEIDGYLFIGATLWTDMDEGNRDCVSLAGKCMMDFSKTVQIGGGMDLDNMFGNQFTANHWLEINEKSFKYIKKVSELNRGKKIVIISHHAPSMLSIHEKYKKYGISNYFFASNYDKFIKDSGAIMWIHGHTHTPFNYKIGDTSIISNPRGYPGEVPDFSEHSLYEV
jgi:predicted phosphodiesterase